MQFGTGNQKNNVFCLLIRQYFVIFVKMKTADGTFGYGYCRDMEDSYSAWKQAEIDIYILYVHRTSWNRKLTLIKKTRCIAKYSYCMFIQQGFAYLPFRYGSTSIPE